MSEETFDANTRQTSAISTTTASSFGSGKVNGKQMSRHFFSRSSLIIVVLSLLLVSASCQPPPICDTIPNTDNQTSPDGTTCNCILITFWNYDLNECVVDCSAITNSATMAELSACTCNAGYIWSPQPTLLCVPDCGSDDYSPGTFDSITG